MSAIKHDKDKPRLDLIPSEALMYEGNVLAFGTTKYPDRNWEQGLDWGRMYAAAMRHMVLWSGGEDVDPESGLHHLAHARSNLGFLLASIIRNIGTDTRFANESKTTPTRSEGVLIKCCNCNKLISDDNEICTHCASILEGTNND